MVSSEEVMSEQDESRLSLELELLRAMYPDQIEWNSTGREVKFTDQSAHVQVRLPGGYPEVGIPDIISARDGQKKDVRDQTKAAVRAAGLGEGDEALDAIIAGFLRVVETNSGAADDDEEGELQTDTSRACRPAPEEGKKTVVIWLHHLLALSKRKLALSRSPISGVTKPGYPGVMIFSGSRSDVCAHVDVLKAENWQAFQVRYEGDELWWFGHGTGVREVETMAKVVEAVAGGPRGERQKQEFLKAVGIK